jgi:hypothetical protein
LPSRSRGYPAYAVGCQLRGPTVPPLPQVAGKPFAGTCYAFFNLNKGVVPCEK